MSGETVGIGVIGAGDINNYHLSGLQAMGSADISVIAGCRAEQRIAPLAAQYGIPDIDAVMILML